MDSPLPARDHGCAIALQRSASARDVNSFRLHHTSMDCQFKHMPQIFPMCPTVKERLPLQRISYQTGCIGFAKT